MSSSTEPIVWIDLEMTGLDPATHVIVEAAAILTDADLNIIGATDEHVPGLDMVIHATEEELARMDDFVTNMHTTSGLLEEIRSSKITLAAAEDAIIALIDSHCPCDVRPLLAGNSIATDRSFIRAHMPRLDERLHYRMIDVSTVKELTRRWYPDAYAYKPAKGLAHRALADIIESIIELAYYQAAVFVAQPGPAKTLSTNIGAEIRARYQQFLQN